MAVGDRAGSSDATVTASEQEGPATNAPSGMPALGLRMGRYVLRSILGHGGMGVVFDAHDPELDRTVAVKVLLGSPGQAGTQGDLRLRREGQTMARLTHPNVLRVYDVGLAHGSVFVAMEYVEGGTLSRWLAAATRSPAEIVAKFVPAGRGLAAAHAAGLVHRDFKPTNVLVGDHDRVLVTDFGLARSAVTTDDGARDTAGPSLFATVTQAGAVLGTPAFMAPEQHAGVTVDAHADQFSFCVALWTALFGVAPYAGESREALAVSTRRGVIVEPPAHTAARIPPRWRAALERGLRPTPDERFASMNELLAELQRPARRARGPARWVAALALVLVASAIGATAWWALSPRAPGSHRPSIAIVGFRDLSGGADSAWLGTAIGELLGGELVARGDVRRIPADGVTRVLRELELADPGTLQTRQLGRVRAQLDADFVLGGAYLATGQRLRIDITLQDTATGETVAAVVEEGAQSSLFDLVASAGERLRSRLGAGGLSSAEAVSARASLPSDPGAARLYAEGLARLRRLDALGARELLERATRLDAGFPLAHAALSEAYHRLGRRTDEEREARLAWEHAGRLAREEQLVVEARLRVTRKEWPRAIELYRALREFFPGTLDYALRLAGVQVDAGQAREARETLAQIRRDSPAAARDARVEIVEANACDVLADYACQERAARTAAAKARALDARELLGEALLLESNAALQVGDRARAARAADEAHVLFVEVGNPVSVGLALGARARVAWKTGRLTTARDHFQDAVEIFRGLGDHDDLARALLGLAGVETNLGHHELAMGFYREALPLFEEAVNRVGLAATHLSLGQQLVNARNLDEGERELQLGLALSREIGKRNYEAIALESLGALYLDRGEPARSVEMERQGKSVAMQIQDVTTIAQTGSKLGAALAALGEVEAAEAELGNAMAALERLGETARIADASAGLASLHLATGRLDEAERLARRAVELHANAAVENADSPALLARVLVARGRVAEARAIVDHMPARADSLDLEIAAAEVELAERHPGRAVARLTRALARGLPEVPDRLEAQLVLARAQTAAGRALEARQTTRALVEESRARGFALVLRRAERR